MKTTFKSNKTSLKLTTLGFTLIELLAVIVILAIIAVIAVPIVIDIIEDTKINSVKSSANMYLKAVELNIGNAKLNENKIPPGTYEIMSDGNLCIGIKENNKCTGEIIKIEVNGEKPTSGEIIIKENNEVKTDNLKINGYNCYEDETNYDCKKAGNKTIESNNGLITLEETKSTLLSNYIIKGNMDGDQGVGTYNATSGEYNIPIRVTGKNMLKSQKNREHSNFGVTIKEFSNQSIFSIVGDCNKDGQLVAVSGNKFKEGEYQIKIEGPQNLKNYYVQEYVGSTHKQNILTGVKENNTYSLVIEEPVRIVIGVTISSGVSYNDEYKVIIQKKGTSKDILYEPYQEKIYTITLDQPLRCVDNVCDYVNYNIGKVIRNVGVDANGSVVKLENSISQDIELPDIEINKSGSNVSIVTTVTPSNFILEYNK